MENGELRIENYCEMELDRTEVPAQAYSSFSILHSQFSIFMPIRPAKRLPKRFRRPVSQGTRVRVQRRYERHRKLRFDLWRRRMRRVSEKLVKLRRYAAFAVIGMLLLGVVGFFLVALFSPLMRVAEVRVVRTDARLDLEQVQSLLAPLFGKHLLLLSGYDVRMLLEEGLPDLHLVEVDKDYPSTLVVRITVDPLIARLMIRGPEEEPVQGEAATIDYLTSEGTYIASARASGGDALPVITLVDWGARPIPGAVLLTPEFLLRVAAAERSLQEQFGQVVLERTVYLRAQEYHLRIAQWTIWFDVQSSLEEYLQRYRIFLREVAPEEVKNYVDLRLKDRVVYR